MKPSSIETVSRELARDLSTRTEEEILEKWSGDELSAVNLILPEGGLRLFISGHNPVFYLAQKVFFDNEPTWLYPPLHRDKICKALLDNLLCDPGKTSGLILCVQRESFKTTLTHGAMALFFALRQKHVFGKDTRIALVHHKELQAGKNLVQLKQKAQFHPWLRANWPEFCPNTDIGTKTEFDWPNKVPGQTEVPSVVAFGLGAINTGFHFDLIIFSDATTDEHRKSKLVREDAVGRYRDTVTMVDTLAGRVSYDATFWHPQDLTQKLLKTEFDGKPAYTKVIVGAGGLHANKPLTFPARHTDEFLERKRQEIVAEQGNDAYWWLQYQNELRATDVAATDTNWLKFIPRREIPEGLWTCIFTDPCWKGTREQGEGDDAVHAVVGFETVGNITRRYLFDLVVSNSLTQHEGIREWVRLVNRYDVQDAAPQRYGGDGFLSALEDTCNSEGISMEFHKLKNANKNKVDYRIAGLLQVIQGGYFYISEDCRHTDKFIDQFIDFPQTDHDDILDAVADCVDPNIVDHVMPVFKQSNFNAAYGSTYEPPRRTLHCGT